MLKEHYKLIDTPYVHELMGRNDDATVYPNYEAPGLRATGLTTEKMRWGFLCPPFYKARHPVTNVRNTSSGYWKSFKPEQRCLVPVSAFAEPDRNTSKPVVFRWFARPTDSDGYRLPFFFAGIWRQWEGDRGTKKAPNVGTHLIYSFLITEANGTVEPVHDRPCRCYCSRRPTSTSG